MVDQKRKSSESEKAYNYKLDGNKVIHTCWKCLKLSFSRPGKTITCFCTLTDELINYPCSGPVGERCPLPDYHYPESEQAHA